MTLLELLDLMKKRIKLVIGLPIVCALLIGVYSFMFMPDTYTATTSMYVLTNQVAIVMALAIALMVLLFF